MRKFHLISCKSINAERLSTFSREKNTNHLSKKCNSLALQCQPQPHSLQTPPYNRTLWAKVKLAKVCTIFPYHLFAWVSHNGNKIKITKNEMLIPSLYVNLAMSFIKATVAFVGIPNSHNFQGFEKVLASIFTPHFS